MRRSTTQPRRPLSLCLIASLIALAGVGGCVERRFTVRTNPPGAVVYVNGEELGPSPVSFSPTYYGDREIVLVADGYETQKVIQPIDAPWYDNELTDFFSECLLPATVRDERDFSYRMHPASNPPTEALVNRADALRNQGKQPPPPRRQGILAWFGF